MKIEFANPGDASGVIQALMNYGLPTADITPDHLDHFLFNLSLSCHHRYRMVICSQDRWYVG